MRKVKIRRIKQIFLAGVIIGILAGILFTMLVANTVITKKEAQHKEVTNNLTKNNEELSLQVSKNEAAHNNAKVLAGNEDGWALALVNEAHPLDTSYVPAELVEIESERSVDSRIAEPLKKMLDDGAAAGLDMYVTSAYRDYEYQRTVFNATMNDWIGQGYKPLDAYDETRKSVAVPGTSEHATGLAVDIISADYKALDDRQGDTDEQKWLMEHCWEYGFILRYPQDKADVTGIIFEPWHYRYVGEAAAKETHEQGLTLEEYLQQ